jgi:hypothetical protein
VFAQANVRTVMGTAQAGAVAIVCAARRGIPVALHTPSEVKAAVTGSGRADKAQVGVMVARLLRLPAAPTPGRRRRRPRAGRLPPLAHARPRCRGVRPVIASVEGTVTALMPTASSSPSAASASPCRPPRAPAPGCGSATTRGWPPAWWCARTA